MYFKDIKFRYWLYIILRLRVSRTTRLLAYKHKSGPENENDKISESLSGVYQILYKNVI